MSRMRGAKSNKRQLFNYVKAQLFSMILCRANEKQDKENLGQKRLSDNTKVDFSTSRDYG